MKKILVVFGTRPEAIKMCPVIRELRRRRELETVVCVTAQHREMLDGVLAAFGVEPDFDLDIMQRGQTLFDLTEKILRGVDEVIDRVSPHAVLVHGDTTTAFAASLAAFYKKIPIGHVEAGLRTGNIFSPFPEEFNRKAVGLVARWHFAPTARAAENLIREGNGANCVYVTGNTVVDALKTTVRNEFDHELLRLAENRRILFLTSHRRENIGAPMRGIFRAVRRALENFGDVAVIYPVHKNPAVRELAEGELGGRGRIFLCEPLGVVDCHNIMARSFAILTDSGGIQEEAAALGKPTLVLRDTTERPEGVESGVLRLVGTDECAVYEEIRRLLTDAEYYKNMTGKPNPYGDGNAAARIADVLVEWE